MQMRSRYSKSEPYFYSDDLETKMLYLDISRSDSVNFIELLQDDQAALDNIEQACVLYKGVYFYNGDVIQDSKTGISYVVIELFKNKVTFIRHDNKNIKLINSEDVLIENPEMVKLEKDDADTFKSSFKHIKEPFQFNNNFKLDYYGDKKEENSFRSDNLIVELDPISTFSTQIYFEPEICEFTFVLVYQKDKWVASSAYSSFDKAFCSLSKTLISKDMLSQSELLNIYNEHNINA